MTLLFCFSGSAEAEQHDEPTLISIHRSVYAEVPEDIEKGIRQFINRAREDAAQWACIKTLEPFAEKTHEPLLHLLIGFAACERNLYHFAQAHLEQCLDGLKRDYPNYPELHFAARYWLGRALLGQGREDKAVELLEEAVRIAESQTGLQQKSLFWRGKTFCGTLGKSMVARLLFDYQREENALKYYLECGGVAGNRYRSGGYYPLDLARCYAALKKHEEALEWFEKTLLLTNWNTCDRQMLHVDAGWQSLALEDWDTALKHARNALSIQPYCRSALVISGRAKVGEGEFEEAAKDIWTAHHLDDDHPDVVSALALLRDMAGRDFVELRASCKPVRPKPPALSDVLYKADFSAGGTHGWRGKIVEVDGEKALKAPALKNNRWYGVQVASPWSAERPLFKVGEKTRIRLKLRVEKRCEVVVQGKDQTQNDNFNTRVWMEPADGWIEEEIPIEAFRDNSHRGLWPQPGDVFRNLDFYAGAPGEDVGLAVSCVEVVGDTQKKDVLAERPEEPWAEVPVFVWADRYWGTDDERWEELRKVGVNGCVICGRRDSTPCARNGFVFYVENAIQGNFLRTGFDVFRMHMERYAAGGYDRRWLTRPVCLLDPGAVEKAHEDLRRIVDIHQANRPAGYSLGDEVSYTGYVNPADFNLDIRTVRRYRTWLQQRYGALDSLNAAWNTEYGSWDEVAVWTIEDVRKRMRGRDTKDWNLAPWYDHMEFSDHLFAGTLQEMAWYLKDIDPWTPVGIGGAQVDTAYGGYDWGRLSGIFDWIEPYDAVDSKNIIINLAGDSPPAFVSVMGPLGGKTAEIARRFVHQRIPWGDSAVLIWQLSSLLDEEGLVIPERMEYHEELERLRNMRKRLPAESVRDDDGVMIAYSHGSYRAGWLMEAYRDNYWWRRFGRYSRDMSAIMRQRAVTARLLRYSGRFPRYVRVEEVFSEEENNPRAVVYPYTIVMSDADIEAARDVLSGGGTVITVGPAGILDEKGKGRAASLPEQLAPASVRTAVSTVVSCAISEPDERKRIYGGVECPKDAGLVLEGSDCLIHMRVGKGRLIVLSNAEDASVERPWGACSPPYSKFSKAVDRVLTDGGLPPSLCIEAAGDGLPRASAYLWKAGGGRYVTFGARLMDASQPPPLLEGRVKVTGALAGSLRQAEAKEEVVYVDVPGVYEIDGE